MDELLVVAASIVAAFGLGVLLAGPPLLGGLLVLAGAILFGVATLVHAGGRR